MKPPINPTAAATVQKRLRVTSKVVEFVVAVVCKLIVVFSITEKD